MLDFLITLLLFSSMEVVSKPLMEHVDSLSLTVARFTLGFAVLLIFTIMRKEITMVRRISFKTLSLLALAGILNTFFSMTMLQKAVEYGSAATAALVFCTNPVFVFVIQIFMKKEKGSILTVAGMCVALCGTALVIVQRGFVFSSGALYGLAAAVAFAIFTVLNKEISKSVNAVNSNVVAFFFGIAASFVYVLITGTSLHITPLFETPSHIVSFLYLGVAVSGIAYITFIRTIRKYSPLSSSVIFLLKPAVAALFSLILLNETMSLVAILGLLLVFIGSLCILWEKKRAQRFVS